jgi:hypothetical protein
MPFPQQLRPKFEEVIDLAVVGDNVAPAIGVHGLGAGLAEIYDGKPTVSQSRSALVFQPGTGSIRSTMLLGVIETLQQI